VQAHRFFEVRVVDRDGPARIGVICGGALLLVSRS
jgi:hypothetical protein